MDGKNTVVKIPEQLQNPSFRFILLRKAEKIPLERDWTGKANYQYNDPKLIRHLEREGNYGCLGGPAGLLVVDVDHPQFIEKIRNALPETFTVRTGGGGYHMYFLCKGYGKRTILYDPETGEHVGEVQSGKMARGEQRTQAVGPGCLHPSGKRYLIESSLPIAQLTKKELKQALVEAGVVPQKDMIPVDTIKRTIKDRQDEEKKGVDELLLSDLIDFSGFKEVRPGVFQGSHPAHGSNTGKNFIADTNQGLWHCFRCGTGGTAFQFYAITKGFLACSQNVSGALTGGLFKKVWGQAVDDGYIKGETKIPLREEQPNEKYLEILQDRSLIEILDRELDKKIVGERESRLTVLLIAFGGKLVENAEPTSSNLMVNDESGAGKDWVVKSVLDLLPNNDIIRRKRITPNVFTYWHNAKFEPGWTWDGKIFYNEDISNSVLNSDVFKVMSSSSGVSRSTVLINQRPFDIEINGKPVMIITIYSASPKRELLRRFPILGLNTTKEQTRKILERKAEYHQRGITPTYNKAVTKSLEYLKRVKVKVSFADVLVNILSYENIAVRTHFDRLIDYIKFSAAIHQKQRSEDDDGYLIATPKDYDFARIALIKTTSNIFSIPLTNNQKKILEIMKKLSQVSIDGGKWFSVSELEPHITFISDRQLYRELKRLATDGFLGISKQERENSRRPVMVFQYHDEFKIDIPRWENIEISSSMASMSCMASVSNLSNNRENERTIDRLDILDKEINGTKQPLPLSTNDESKNEKKRNVELNAEYSQKERVNIILDEVKTLSNEKNLSNENNGDLWVKEDVVVSECHQKHRMGGLETLNLLKMMKEKKLLMFDETKKAYTLVGGVP